MNFIIYCSGHKVLVERSQRLSAETHRTLTRSLAHFLHKFQFFLTGKIDIEDNLFLCYDKLAVDAHHLRCN